MAKIEMTGEQMVVNIGKAVQGEIKEKILSHLLEQVKPELERIAAEAAKAVAVRILEYRRSPDHIFGHDVIQLSMRFGDGAYQNETLKR